MQLLVWKPHLQTCTYRLHLIFKNTSGNDLTTKFSLLKHEFLKSHRSYRQIFEKLQKKAVHSLTRSFMFTNTAVKAHWLPHLAPHPKVGGKHFSEGKVCKKACFAESFCHTSQKFHINFRKDKNLQIILTFSFTSHPNQQRRTLKHVRKNLKGNKNRSTCNTGILRTVTLMCRLFCRFTTLHTLYFVRSPQSRIKEEF